MDVCDRERQGTAYVTHTHTLRSRSREKVFFVGSSQKAISPFMAGVCCCCRLGRRCPATQLSHKTASHHPAPPTTTPWKSCCHHNLQQQNLSEGVIRLGPSLSPTKPSRLLTLGQKFFHFSMCEWGKVFFQFYLLVSCAAS